MFEQTNVELYSGNPAEVPVLSDPEDIKALDLLQARRLLSFVKKNFSGLSQMSSVGANICASKCGKAEGGAPIYAAEPSPSFSAR